MPSASGHYDEALLAAAPATTKAQIQEGYSTDLLNTPQGNATPPLLSSPQVDVERRFAHKEYNAVTNSKPTPFFRTRKGMITIAVLILVVLAAIIGGAVGGSTHNNKANANPQVSGEGGSGGSTTTSGSASSETVPTLTTSAGDGSENAGPSVSVSSRPSQSTVTSLAPGSVGVSPISSSSSQNGSNDLLIGFATI